MTTNAKVQELRATLGDRLTTSIQDFGNGPVLAYAVDGTGYSLEDAVTKFLPADTTVEWRTINPQSVSRALKSTGIITRPDYSKPGIRCMKGAFKDEVTISVFVGDSGIDEQDDRDNATTADALRTVLTDLGYTVFDRESTRAIFSVKRAVEPAPVAAAEEPAPTTQTPEVSATDIAAAEAAVVQLTDELRAAPTVPALPTVAEPTAETVQRPETLSEWQTRNPMPTKPVEQDRPELAMRHPEGENLTLF